MSNRYLYGEQSQYCSFWLIFLVKGECTSIVMWKTQLWIKLKLIRPDQGPTAGKVDHRSRLSFSWYTKITTEMPPIVNI